MPYATKVVRRIGWSAATVLSLLPLVFSGAAANAATPGPAPVLLGTADAFAVLAGTTITNTGSSVITGNLGLHPGSAVVGFPPGTVSGSTHAGDAAAQQAATDLTTAYDDAAGRSFTAKSPADLGGRTLTQGVYRTGAVASLGLTGRVTLDAQGDPRAVFIFQIPTTLITATDSSVRLINGAQACNVFWQVGSSATLGTRTAFQGNVLAATSISASDGVTVKGRLLARTGAVTLINDEVTRAQCAAGTEPTATSPGSGTGTAPGAISAPRVLDVSLSKPAVVGRDTSVVVDTVNTGAPVSGMSVQVGSGRDVFGASACRPADSRGIVPRAFRPGTRTRLSAPLRFNRTGPQKVLVRVDSGGCSPAPTSVYHTVTVTPTRPGEPPRPVVVGPPTEEKPRGTLLPPLLPAGLLPDVGLPALPDLGAGIARRGKGCRGADKRLGTTRSSLKLARRALLCLLNQTRRAHRLKPLRPNPRLLKAAERHSKSMVVRGYFSHVDPGGGSSVDRVRRTGYLSGARTWTCGENIGWGDGPTSTPRNMMRAWMASAPHRANILTRGFREVGLGGVPGRPGRPGPGAGTYTTVFGGRR